MGHIWVRQRGFRSVCFEQYHSNAWGLDADGMFLHTAGIEL